MIKLSILFSMKNLIKISKNNLIKLSKIIWWKSQLSKNTIHLPHLHPISLFVISFLMYQNEILSCFAKSIILIKISNWLKYQKTKLIKILNRYVSLFISEHLHLMIGGPKWNLWNINPLQCNWNPKCPLRGGGSTKPLWKWST